ncbi:MULTISPECIES: hypothetical protein [Cyanophyceae]|uniref:hypothetical protein n=1 Tax=Cyanophyceae TaxID=3028117 RepID=UPI00016DCEFE|nr:MULTISPECIES: hypothetical protein [Cyanophyceae]ACB01009.1 conserved hypothetical protein [Picosynechococcus sp. PCC 7002]SMH58375.1 hypothetical protein SAMN06272755_3155 [Picosynechococcus sp. OG1]SMQ86403.1 hypothetical protein SAMN06272774_3146 [Synechococcus sp. 7002]
MKNRAKKLLIMIPLSTSIILISTAKSEASVLDVLKNTWNQTTQIISGAFETYVGSHVEDFLQVYLPQGIEAITGALGLPDPSGIFAEIRDNATLNQTDINDIAEGILRQTEVAAGTSSTLGEIVFSAEGQQNTEQLSATSTQISTTSGDLADQCQTLNITQEVMKCMTLQMANETQLSRIQIEQNQQILQQLAANNIAQANVLKTMARAERTQQAEQDRATNQILREVQFNNALVDDL